jgi:hypothetical protein
VRREESIGGLDGARTLAALEQRLDAQDGRLGPKSSRGELSVVLPEEAEGRDRIALFEGPLNAYERSKLRCE